MGCVIKYNTDLASKEISRNLSVLTNRYNTLKKTMLDNTAITQLRKKRIQVLRNFLTVINANAAKLTDNKILELLQSGTQEGLSQTLQSLAIESTQLVGEGQKGIEKDRFFSSLGKLYSLLEIGRGNQAVSFDYNSLVVELDKIASGLLNSDYELKETGNILGRIGAQGAAPLVIQSGIDNIINSLKAPSNNVNITIKDTGSKKIIGTNKTVTTDTYVVTTDPTTGRALASIRISDKFNAKYKKNSNSTGTPIKLATRTIKNFLEEANPSYKNDYEKALINYISYHKKDLGDYHRQDIIKDNSSGWKILRQAIGAEMIYNELYYGKGKFLQDNEQVEDIIDLYIYGDKIFLADDILSTINQKKGKAKGQFNMAQISLNQRRKILTNTNHINSLPTKQVLSAYRTGGEELSTNVVYQIIEHSQISYSQTIKFN